MEYLPLLSSKVRRNVGASGVEKLKATIAEIQRNIPQEKHKIGAFFLADDTETTLQALANQLNTAIRTFQIELQLNTDEKVEGILRELKQLKHETHTSQSPPVKQDLQNLELIPLVALVAGPVTTPPAYRADVALAPHRVTACPTVRRVFADVTRSTTDPASNELAAQKQDLRRELRDIRCQMTADILKERRIVESLRELEAEVEGEGDATEVDFVTKARLEVFEAEPQTEWARRRRLEEIVEDVRRERRAPFVVPALLDTLIEISQLTSELICRVVGFDSPLPVSKAAAIAAASREFTER
ncbi:hypothetical protein B0H13DRAFT_1884184 [Mycena leptocephala]|nr:hypothetical protein B0H13DRAFT_1884184 [Mycena leptocephala]